LSFDEFSSLKYVELPPSPIGTVVNRPSLSQAQSSKPFNVVEASKSRSIDDTEIHLSMMQRIGSALEPLLIVPKKEVGVSKPDLCIKDAGMDPEKVGTTF
jgi:hypothetical protein